MRAPRWVEVARRFTPPSHPTAHEAKLRLAMMGYASRYEVDRMIYGETVIELRHQRSGKVRFVEQIGDQR